MWVCSVCVCVCVCVNRDDRCFSSRDKIAKIVNVLSVYKTYCAREKKRENVIVDTLTSFNDFDPRLHTYWGTLYQYKVWLIIQLFLLQYYLIIQTFAYSRVRLIWIKKKSIYFVPDAFMMMYIIICNYTSSDICLFRFVFHAFKLLIRLICACT